MCESSTMEQQPRFIYWLYFVLNNEKIPIMSRIGNARYKSPPNTIPSRITGRNTIVISNLEMLHAARIPKKNNFPKMPNRKIKNNNSNIFSQLLLCIFLLLSKSSYSILRWLSIGFFLNFSELFVLWNTWNTVII